MPVRFTDWKEHPPKPPTGRISRLNIAVTPADAVAIRNEAARLGITVAELVRRWMEPHLSELKGME